MQITGFFEAGDALRNTVHDLKIPLLFIVGLRSYFAHQRGPHFDTCPVFAEPILQAWRLPYRLLTDPQPEDLRNALAENQRTGQARVLLIAE
jgi:hypothetical protein